MTTRSRLFALVCVALVGGCPLPEGSSYGRPCSADDDCAEGYRCWTDTCVPDAFGDLPHDDAGDPRKDAGTNDAGNDDAGASDAGARDAGVDAGDDDAGPVDGGDDDAGPVDAGDDDAGDSDAGDGDAGVPDAGDDDAGAPDGGPNDDGGETDAGPTPWCDAENVRDIDLSVNASYHGDTREGVDALVGELCHIGPAREQVLRFVADEPGTLHFELESALDLGVVVLDHCDGAPDHQRGCYEHARPGHVERGRVDLTSGEVVYLAVDGFGPGDEAPWTMTFEFVEAGCGNGHADPGEACDVTAFWCVSCQIAADQWIEDPDDTTGAAIVYGNGGPASISPAGDVDVFSVWVTEPNSAITARVSDTFGGSACLDREVLEPLVEILDEDGVVLAMADGGRSSCPVARALAPLPGQNYSVRVRRTTNVDYNSAETFPYHLQVETSVPQCGNGTLEIGEQCDDQNIIPGDGCDATCAFETEAEVEPNDDGIPNVGARPRNRGNDFTISAVHGPIGDDVVIEASIDPVGDEDGYWLVHTGATSATVTARIVNPAGPLVECDVATLDLLLHVLDQSEQIILTGDTPTEVACDEVTFVLPPGVHHYLHVHDYGDDTVVDRYYLQIEFTPNAE